MHLFDKNVTTAVEFVGAIFPYITYGVVFVQFHWLNQSRDIPNI